MEFTINSRKHGKVTFSRPGKSYVFVDINGLPRTLRKQICSGGYFLGNTISWEGDHEGFKKLCRRWWKNYLKNNQLTFED